MSDKVKTMNLSLDPNIKTVKAGNMTVWSHDKDSFKIMFDIDNGCGGPLILTDAKPRILLILGKDIIQVFDLTIVSERLGQAYFIIPDRILGYEGRVKASVYVDYEDKTHDLGSFYFDMKKSDVDGEFEGVSLYIESVETALKKAEELNEQIKDRDLVTRTELAEVEKKKANKESVNKLEQEVSTKATKQETDNKLEKKTNNTTFVAITSDMQRQIESTQSGMLGTYNSEAELNASYPNGEKGYAIVWFTENGQKVGYTYTYKNNNWTKGNVWNGVGISNKSVTPIKTTFIEPAKNLINFDTIMIGYSINSKGEPFTNEWIKENFCLSDFIEVKKNTMYIHHNVTQVARYNDNKEYINVSTGNPSDVYDARYIRVVMNKKNYMETQVNEGEKLLEWDNGKHVLGSSVNVQKNSIIDFVVNNKDISNDEISDEKIKSLGSSIDLAFTKDLINIDTNNRIVEIPEGIVFIKGSYVYKRNEKANFTIKTHHAYFYVNLKTGEIKLETSVYNANTISKDFSLFLIVSFESASSNDITSIYLKGDYKINSKIASRFNNQTSNLPEIESKEKIYFSEAIPHKSYVPIEPSKDFSAETHYVDKVKMTDVLNNFDKTVADFPNWATKTELGLDSSGTYPIFKYEFKPEQVPSSKFNKKYQKIILIGGTHGEEKLSPLSLSQYIYDLAYNWEKDTTLEYVRYNTHLIIIPILNPWGFHNFKRWNVNKVDINRNSSERWATSSSSNPEAIDYKGTAPFSEKENQYFRDLILENKDATAFFDYHMNGTSGGLGDYEHNFWHSIADYSDKEGFKEINEISKRNIMLMTRVSQSKYQIPKDSGWCGMISYNGTQSTLTAYAYAQGIPSMTIECLKKLQHENVVYSKDVINLATEFIGNHILNVCRSFINQTTSKP